MSDGTLHFHLPRATAIEQKVLHVLQEHFAEIPFLSAKEVAMLAKIDPSRVTRVCQKMGFKGYPDVQHHARLELREHHALDKPLSQDHVLEEYLGYEQRNLAALSHISASELDKAVELLYHARRVYVVGTRGSAAVAHYAKHILRFLRQDVWLITSIDHDLESIFGANVQDVVMVFTVKRYSRTTSKMVEKLADQGSRVILISDGGITFLKKLSQVHFSVDTQSLGGFRSYTAMLSLCHVLMVYLAEKTGYTQAKKAEKLWGELDVFEF